jgi:CHAT domain-containing protein
LHVVTSGSLDDIDVHALAFQGAPLIEHAPVAYALYVDTPAHPQPTTANAPARALLVADPRGDLPGARIEAANLQLSLPSAAVLLGGHATRAQVLVQLARSELFHYAGHGRADLEDGLEHSLSLAAGTSLTAADILALPRVPRQIVLSACDTAHIDASAGLDLNTAQAFLLAGAQAVAAASRRIPDALGSAFAQQLYRRHPESPASAVAVRDAVLNLRAAQPGADWAAFRALVP